LGCQKNSKSSLLGSITHGVVANSIDNPLIVVVGSYERDKWALKTSIQMLKGVLGLLVLTFAPLPLSSLPTSLPIPSVLPFPLPGTQKVKVIDVRVGAQLWSMWKQHRARASSLWIGFWT